jgi:hypothetical protein
MKCLVISFVVMMLAIAIGGWFLGKKCNSDDDE